MATSSPTTPFGVTKPSAHFTHTEISRTFSRLIGAVSTYIEAERDIEDAASWHPAFLHWHRDAETARTQVLTPIDRIRSSAVVRLEDLPLKRMALLLFALIESGSSSEFLRLAACLDQPDGLFDCPGTDPVARRVEAMLTAARMQVADLTSLSAFVDPLEIATANSPDHPVPAAA
ncbi:hypothetical protein EYF88_15915 [Paracoccus sediminis]|uniref:Uncharacterized protein n=1 Tax=Paracoccus sediminis TaxID=1214787 RepID=A0A238YAC4_9RHOB|nr:hypothetical protein [Paracoccus sediminis]TBN46998.1 hypothetical protein EYF88_15915 [Paracoccus sediminis]SNR67573.1 hypothetical protein SAMN06265378_11611 [Paracoccus sediminis]